MRTAGFGLRPVALALACMGSAPVLAQLPSWNSFVVRGGAVSVGSGPGNLPLTTGGMPSAAGTILPINQTSTRAIIDWQGFSIGQGNAVNITQPSARSVLLNRVTGSDPSAIAGSMTANGRVFLVNPNGVLFTGTSTVDVGGLVASTLKLSNSDADFMSGTEHFVFKQDLNFTGSTENRGTITTRGNGGTIALMGGNVVNSGTLNAHGGTAALVTGDTVTVDPFGDGLTTFKVAVGSGAGAGGVTNSGTVQADGGRVALQAAGGTESGGVVNVRGVLRADSMASRNGEILLDSGSSPLGVTLTGGTVSAMGNGPGLTGGQIKLSGQTVLVEPYQPIVSGPVINEPALIDASGSAGGGTIRLQAGAVAGGASTGAIAIASSSTLRADALSSGNGGDIRVMADRTLRAYGSISAKGGAAGGNGGFIETSGGFALPAGESNGGVELNGLRIDADAAPGTGGVAGTWLVDPFNVNIVSGAASGSLTGNPFVPLAASIVQDGDINAALNGGTSVRITTGVGGAATVGDINFNAGVNINYTAANGPLTLQLDAHRSIRSFASNVTIQSSGAGGPLNVVFNANADGASSAVGGGQISYDGNIYSNGGNVAMTGNWTAAGGADASIHLTGIVDTRAGNVFTALPLPGTSSGGSNALAGGAVTLNGNSTTAAINPGSTQPAVWLDGARVLTSTGNVTINGNSTSYIGVQIAAPQGIGAISTTSGTVTVTGRGRDHLNGSSFLFPAAGVLVSRASIGTVSGGITLRGYVDDIARTPSDSAGLRIENGAQITTTGGGNIELTGRAQNNAAGLRLEAGAVTGATLPSVQGSAQVVLRADNDRSTDAIVLSAPVSAGSVLNLRPGGLDATGVASDSVGAPISLAGGAATGFAVSSAELALMTAPTLVVGSDAHAADINVNGAISRTGALTLQNQAAGNINLNAPIAVGQLGLLAGGNIAQAAGAPIAATTLLARSGGGSVVLSNAANDVGTVGGGAAGRFEYTDANAVTLGPATVVGYNAAGATSQTQTSTTASADTLLVRTLSGDLSLAGGVSSTTSADLVAASRFQSLGANSIAGAPWRIWADTWVGESRAGLAGSGTLPNLYACAYLGLCAVSIPAGANHFIYAQQPTATVTIADASRVQGAANPPFFFSITGLILGDTAAGFAGVNATTANALSPPGSYAIGGTYISAAGYAVTVVPGTLTVTAAPTPPIPPMVLFEFPKPDVYRDLPVTWTFDRNIAPPPICFATGPLDGDRAAQGSDVLAREWSRVRSRPNLASCVDTERRNGCADF